MTARGIDVFVTENVRNQIDIACLAIKRRAVRAAKLVRRYFFTEVIADVYFSTRFSTERTLILFRCME